MGNNNSANESYNQNGNGGNAEAAMIIKRVRKPKPKLMEDITSCHVCGKKFYNERTVLRHIAVCEGERYMCHYPNCTSIFTSKYTMEEHARIHRGEKPLSCLACKKSSRHQSGLRRHRKIHTGEKQYSCKVCEKSFTQLCHLKAPLRVHTGEKPHACKVCEKSFSHVSQLKDHLRVHTGEKYVCGVREKAFAHFSSLRRHEKTHTKSYNGVKEFICAHCGKSYPSKSLVKKHLEKCFKEHDFQDRFDDRQKQRS